MKFARSVVKSVTVCFFVLFVAVFSSIIYIECNVSDDFSLNSGDELKLDYLIPIRTSYCSDDSESVNYNTVSGDSFKMDIKVLGIIPAKKINVRVIDKTYVAVMGTPFGIKLYTDGVLVSGFSEVKTDNGSENPAKEAGLRVGDFIISLNEIKVYSNEEVANIIKNSEGGLITAKIKQNGKNKTISFYPAKSKNDGIYRAGIWVKDSSAGIGTMTFYSPASNVVAGLGHGICDSDSGALLSLNKGEFVTADINSFVKGYKGKTGELNGSFAGKKIADFELNRNNGVYGTVTCDINVESLTQVALKQDVRNGSAYILTTIDGNTPDYYSCNIKIRNMDDTQSLLVEITDERLLATTGGIVQGMSGSPIIQNGKLVGAVTHVLVDDPTKGYAIFAENMLETAESVAEEKLKEAP